MAVLTVLNTNNSGEGSLRQAIADAAYGDTIVFDSALSGATITLESELVPATRIIIDGSALTNKITISGGNTFTDGVSNNDGVRVFNCATNTSSRTSEIYSLNLTNGYTAENGGGAFYGRFYDCVFSRNTAGVNGGGAFNGVHTRCVIEYNSAYQGGGIHSGTSAGCEIKYNSATYSGGAVGGTRSNCLFIHNTSGSCIRTGEYLNCTIAYNNGYGVRQYSANDSSIFKNCIITGNTDGDVGTVYTANAFNTLSSFTGWTNAADEGVINYEYDSSLPLFTDAANDDYTLAPNSQAAGRGDNAYITAGDTDLAGNTRIRGAHPDLGCYEFQPLTLDAPTVTIVKDARTATISIDWPETADSAILLYSTDSTFATCTELNLTSQTDFTVSNLGGTVYFRAKSTLSTDPDEESYFSSDWSAAVSEYFDNVAPVIVGVNPEVPIVMMQGVPTDLDAGVTVTDNVDADLLPFYEIYDSDGNIVTDDNDNYVCVDSDVLAVGEYTIIYYAIDASGNESQNVERDLSVVPRTVAPTQFTDVKISAAVSTEYSTTISVVL